MADNKDVDSGEESGGHPGTSNSTDQTAAVIPEESVAEEVAESGDHGNQAVSSSTIQTQDLESVSGTDPLEKMEDPLEIIFELRRRLSLLKIRRRKVSPDYQEQSTGPPRGPATRNLPPEDCLCFRKKLTLTDASHDDGKLDIEPLKAVWIPICPEIPKDSHDSRKSVELKVFDYENTQYNMVLTGYNYEGIVLYSINGEWRNFIRAHNLQHGDLIYFCKNRDPRINGDDYYYVILFAKKTDGDFIIEDEDEDEDEKEEEEDDEDEDEKEEEEDEDEDEDEDEPGEDEEGKE